MARPIRAAGGVVFRRTDSGPEFLLIRRPRYKDWTLPKGKIDRGEGPAEAAFREVREETGFQCRPVLELGSIGYQLKGGRFKAVRYWLMEAEKGKFTKNNEVDKVVWLNESDAIERLSFRKDKDVLAWAARLQTDPAHGRIHLLRHGSAGTRGKSKADIKRPLSKKGIRQSQKIGRRLSRLPVERALSSPYPRCLATLGPLADSIGTTIEEDERLAEGSSVKKTLSLISELRGQAAVLCTHGDIISNLIGHLSAEGVPLDGGMEWPKGSEWTLETMKGRVVSGHFRKAPS